VIEALDQGAAKITVDFGEAHNLSIGVLKDFQAKSVNGGTGAVALVLSAGRILSPEVLSDDDEISFVQAAMDWLGMYFAEGGKN
jgi:hypothetical protein